MIPRATISMGYRVSEASRVMQRLAQGQPTFCTLYWQPPLSSFPRHSRIHGAGHLFEGVAFAPEDSGQ